MTPEENLIIQTAKVSDTVLAATAELIRYLEGHTSKTELVNQLQSISTPDVKYVVEALQVLDATLKTHENTDLSGVTALMQQLLDQARLIPKEHPEQREVDYTEQLRGLLSAVQAVEQVVKAQKLVAEAPVVNVPQTSVHVDAPDLEPLQTNLKAVVKAIQSIVIPEYKTDNAAVEKLLGESNKLLTRLLAKPVNAGGGGGGSSWTAVNGSDLPTPLHVDAAGNLRVTSAYVTERYDYSSATTIYTALAPLGTGDASTGWQITKYDLTDTANASGKIATDVSWTNRATGTYA